MAVKNIEVEPKGTLLVLWQTQRAQCPLEKAKREPWKTQEQAQGYTVLYKLSILELLASLMPTPQGQGSRVHDHEHMLLQ